MSNINVEKNTAHAAAVDIETEARELHKTSCIGWMRWEQLGEPCKEEFRRNARRKTQDTVTRRQINELLRKYDCQSPGRRSFWSKIVPTPLDGFPNWYPGSDSQ